MCIIQLFSWIFVYFKTLTLLWFYSFCNVHISATLIQSVGQLIKMLRLQIKIFSKEMKITSYKKITCFNGFQLTISGSDKYFFVNQKCSTLSNHQRISLFISKIEIFATIRWQNKVQILLKIYSRTFIGTFEKMYLLLH